MDKTKRKLVSGLFYLYLVLFPFGQLARWELTLEKTSIPIHPTDIVAGFIFILVLLGKFPKPAIFRHIENFIYMAGFSFLLSLVIFRSPEAALGALYLLRLVAYSFMFLAAVTVARPKEKWLSMLLGICFAVGIFGWFQYFVYPDLRALFAWGWDDHFLRMVGTFLDPTFTSIFLVFGFLFSMAQYFSSKKKVFALLGIFFLVSVAFTYTRAAYIALIGGSAAILIALRKVKLSLLIVAVLLVIAVSLPRGASEGVKLERLYSVYSRLANYRETATIFSKSPLFGIGYNNLCLARKLYIGPEDTYSHSCSGSDSGLLLVLATTGAAGFLVFLKMVIEIFKSIGKDVYGLSFLGASVALAVHGFFANSYFYPWVMGFMGISLALALKEKTSE